jgi:hypothetical protein
MHGLGLAALRISPARLHPPGLERLAIAARRYFAVAALARKPDLQVIGFGGREASIASRQGDYPVWQLQALQYQFGIRRQFFQSSVRLLWTDHMHQFHFFELVLANHAARILAIRAGLRTKARCMRREFQRQISVFQNSFARQVRQWHFGRRNQEEILVALDRKQVFLEFRQLPGANQ